MATYFWQRRDTRLRPLTDQDVDLYLSADLDSEAKRSLNYAIGLPRSKQSQATSLPISFKNGPRRLDFAVEALDGTFVGFTAIDSIEEQSGNFSTVTFILEPYRREGHAENAKHLMLSYMFDERRFEKYNTECIETNEAVIGHLKKLGCIEEGRRRRRIFTNGRYYDQILFGLTKEEWRARVS
jgi:RimJ/RimL family protein N-acetyltransferase